MMSDQEYDRLYEHQPTSTKGRAWLAGYLIRNGRACTRLYDNCFENWDGLQVLAWLMKHVREKPSMRQQMEEQGAWSRDYEHTPEPEPLVIGEAERIAGFKKATCSMAGAAARWTERAAKGLNDEDLAYAFAFEIGTFGGSCSPDGICIEYKAASLQIWISWVIQNSFEAKPVFRAPRQSPWPGSLMESEIRPTDSWHCPKRGRRVIKNAVLRMENGIFGFWRCQRVYLSAIHVVVAESYL